MKLKYEKPLIAVEQYALSQAIASCGTKVGYNDNICMSNDSDVPEILQGFASEGYFGDGRCLIPMIGMDFDDNVCYHTNINLLFCS